MFETVTETIADVVVFPEESLARAVTLCWPFVWLNVFQLTEKGAAVSSAPTGAPSTRNCTPATESWWGAAAGAVTVAPEPRAPAVGAVTDTVGGVVSQADVVPFTVARVDLLSEKSYASTEI